MKGNPFEQAAQDMKSGTDVIYSSTELQRTLALVEGVKQLQNLNQILAISDLSSEQIMLFSKARIMSDFWNIPEIELILNDLAIMLLSKNRKSREEVLKALIGMSGAKKKFGERVKEVFNPKEQEQ